jgi:cobalt-precorrin-7 (C5)-methyltransferase
VQQALAKLNIVGVGPGSPEYVTPAARMTVVQADVVVGAQRSLNLFSGNIKGESVVLTAKNLYDSLKKIAELVNTGKNVVLLSTGDPGFSGLLHTVLDSGFFNEAQLNVVPAVSSIQACAARLNISWDKAQLFTFHEGKVSEEKKQELVLATKNRRNILLLPDSRAFTPKDIANYLIEAGVNSETLVYVCENITLENEKITLSTLGKAAKENFDSLSVMVLKANSK